MFTRPVVPARATGPGPIARRRLRRWGAIPLLALALLASSASPVQAGPAYDMCIELVDQFAHDCMAGAESLIERTGCRWLGGVAYMGCVVIGAIEHFFAQR